MNKTNWFRCQHKGAGQCFIGRYKCAPDCRLYGDCGTCRNYYIPAGQEPCSLCEHLNINRPSSQDGFFTGGDGE